MRALGDRWYEHPAFSQKDYRAGLARITHESDAFFASLGYEHLAGTGSYRVLEHSDKRIALFAHQGFGVLFLSCVLDIPYPEVCTRMDIQHSGVSVIRFANHDGLVIPTLLQLSNDSHLYREGLSLRYNNQFEL